jgi:hypothetical protein
MTNDKPLSPARRAELYAEAFRLLDKMEQILDSVFEKHKAHHERQKRIRNFWPDGDAKADNPKPGDTGSI